MEKVCSFCPNKDNCGFIIRDLQSKCDIVDTYYLGIHDSINKIHEFFEELDINDYVSSITNGVGIVKVNTDKIKEKLINKISDKLIGIEILGLDINGQWYDSINNDNKPIKNPFNNEE